MQNSDSPERVLVIDVGGSNVKMIATNQTERIKVPSPYDLYPDLLVDLVKESTSNWHYDAISIGCPCVCADNKPTQDPVNLGVGWVGFDFSNAFSVPCKVTNDAAMQAVGCYEGGTMLFLGFGTGLGTTLIKDYTPMPLEAGHLPYRDGFSFEGFVGKPGLERLGFDQWHEHALKTIQILREAFNAEDVVLGGGNAKLIAELPEGARRVNNHAAFVGGFRLWDEQW